jgi:hypothetical protein
VCLVDLRRRPRPPPLVLVDELNLNY